MRDYAKDERRLRQAALAAVGRTSTGRCPGWKRACGVTTPRDLCFFCTRSRAIEKETE